MWGGCGVRVGGERKSSLPDGAVIVTAEDVQKEKDEEVAVQST